MDGIFSINKPSGVTSRLCLDKINRILSNASCSKEALDKLRDSRKQANGKSRKKWLTRKLKMGHGGTLDPLASGVLVIGVGSGTKKLGDFTNGSTKVYECVGLLGGSTTTGDSEGELLQKTENDFVTKKILEDTRKKFIGTLDQTPPIFSALKMDGKPLYEYAREGKPLPRAIKSREVKVYDFTLGDDCLSTSHDYRFLKSQIDEDGKTLVEKLSGNPTLDDHRVSFSREYLTKAKAENLPTEADPTKLLQDTNKYSSDEYRAPIIHFTSTVSSGTYIRSLVSDFGRSMGTSSYMVKLIRARQAEWELSKNVFEMEDFEKYGEEVWAPVLMKVLTEGSEVNVRKEMDLAIAKFSHDKNTEDKAEKEQEDDYPRTKKQRTK